MKLRQTKTNFTAGEVDPRFRQRVDLPAHENGAGTLTNVCILHLGGVRRRPGLRHHAVLPGPCRLLAFEFNTEQTYLIALVDAAFLVFMDGILQASVAAPWTEAQLGQISWTQSADTLLVVHPGLEPQKITRTSHVDWTIGPWTYVETTAGRIRQPQHKYAPDAAVLNPSATTGNITLRAKAKKGGAFLDLFEAGHVGQQWMVGDKAVTITAITDATLANATVVETLGSSSETTDFSEPAWSSVRGWPVSCTFHQSRLVVGGSGGAPHWIWASQTADLFNFETGSGADDQAIAIPILSDQVNAVRAVFSGRHLQVLTSGAEFMVLGEPLTPTSIELRRQTRVGSPIDRIVPPVSIDGATVFLPRVGSGLFAFVYEDIEQAYRASDLALLAGHILAAPVAMAYDPVNRWLHLVNADGTAATVTIYREQDVQGSSRQVTAGSFRAAAQVGGVTWWAVERPGGWCLECFDDAVQTDAALTGTADPATVTWSGADHLEGIEVRVVANGADAGVHTVGGGQVVLDDEASSVEIGLAYAHAIAPLPLNLTRLEEAAPGVRVRLVAATLHLHQVRALRLDTGLGPAPVPLRALGDGLLDAPLPAFTGAKTVRGIGWSRSGEAAWRIEDDTPMPWSLLAVEAEYAINP